MAATGDERDGRARASVSSRSGRRPTGQGDTVSFDYFTLDGPDGCEEPPPENTPPLIESATASPSSGFGPLQVDLRRLRDRRRRRHAHLQLGLRRRRHGGLDGRGSVPHLHRSRVSTRPRSRCPTARPSDSQTVTVTVLAADDPERPLPGPGVLEDDRLPPRLDRRGHRRDPGARARERVPGRRHRGRQRCSATRCSPITTPSSSSRRPAIHSTTRQQAAFERYIRAGGGFTGIHAAADTEYDWNWYGHLVGGYFLSHPPGRPPRRSTSRT